MKTRFLATTLIQATLFAVALIAQSCTTTSDVDEEDASLYEKMEIYGEIDDDVAAYPWLSSTDNVSDSQQTYPAVGSR